MVKKFFFNNAIEFWAIILVQLLQKATEHLMHISGNMATLQIVHLHVHVTAFLFLLHDFIYSLCIASSSAKLFFGGGLSGTGQGLPSQGSSEALLCVQRLCTQALPLARLDWNWKEWFLEVGQIRYGPRTQAHQRNHLAGLAPNPQYQSTLPRMGWRTPWGAQCRTLQNSSVMICWIPANYAPIKWALPHTNVHL